MLVCLAKVKPLPYQLSPRVTTPLPPPRLDLFPATRHPSGHERLDRADRKWIDREDLICLGLVRASDSVVHGSWRILLQIFPFFAIVLLIYTQPLCDMTSL
ncbi:hypothetical protein LX36DRAFT_257308 [Colletotrichum falcatum]|nr:hypothetical protein LX36DRAFT_257308 [Colletotrichum falcatum]